MAPRFPWRRKADDESDDDPDETVDLDDAAHMWWTTREPEELWRPKDRQGPTGPAPERDVLAEHLGADWREQFGFDRPDDPPPDYPDPQIDGPEPSSDSRPAGSGSSTDSPAAGSPVEPANPYDVLGLPASASWDEIVEAHRRLARQHHPDRVGDGTDEERATSERLIRDINAAYAELRIRRGR